MIEANRLNVSME